MSRTCIIQRFLLDSRVRSTRGSELPVVVIQIPPSPEPTAHTGQVLGGSVFFR